MIIAIAVVLGIVVVAAAVLLYSGGGNDSDGSGDGASWHVGDYVEWGYYYYENGTAPGEPYGFQRYTVTEVGAEWLAINESTYNAPLNQGGVLTYWTTTHVSANVTGFGGSVDSWIMLGYDVLSLGTDTVTTDWGQLSAEHYRYSMASGGATYTYDLWTRNGFDLMYRTISDSSDIIMMKMITSSNIKRAYS